MKKKIFVITLVVSLLVLSIAGSSMAYFTDTEQVTNTFTTGNVDIKLSEINPADGTLTEIVNPITGFAYKNIYPGQVIAKQPTITNVSNTEDSVYTGAIITLTNAAGLLPNEAAVKKFLDGGALNTDGVATTKYVINDTDNTITVYAIINAPLEYNASVDVFANVAVPKEWTNEQMAIFASMEITIKAYATQIPGFSGAEEAITSAFTNDWTGYTTP